MVEGHRAQHAQGVTEHVLLNDGRELVLKELEDTYVVIDTQNAALFTR